MPRHVGSTWLTFHVPCRPIPCARPCPTQLTCVTRHCAWRCPRAKVVDRVIQATKTDRSFDDYDDDEWEALDDDLAQSPESPPKRLPARMRCFDTATILVAPGSGGKGCVAFRREKFVPKGGPSGGNGGNGGSVYLKGDASLNSLLSFRRCVHFRAEDGAPGLGSSMHGQGGKDTIIPVPPGTLVWRRDDDEEYDDGAAAIIEEEDTEFRDDWEEGENAGGRKPLAEVLLDGQLVCIARGGKGGRGNLAFKTARNSAPTLAEHGEAGEELWLRLEMRLVADAGLIGSPNAGKSTLLSVLSAARPKIAAYPFTTLTPNLGVCALDGRTTVYADVPGLVDGAHAGRGLGHAFLRHCTRCRVLVHVVDGSGSDPAGDYMAVRQELEMFDPGLASKPTVVVYNKMDLPHAADYAEDIREELMSRYGIQRRDFFTVSAATGSRVQALARRVRQVLDEQNDREVDRAALVSSTQQLPSERWDAEERRKSPDENLVNAPRVAYKQLESNTARPSDFAISKDLSGPRVWTIRGAALERLAQMTDWSYFEAASRFQNVLKAAGVDNALVAAGVREGDTVVIGTVEFEWTPDDAKKGQKHMYATWLRARKESGVPTKGAAKWPHPGG